MKKFTRLLAAILLAACLLGCFAGCSTYKDETMLTVNGVKGKYDDLTMHMFFVKYSYFSNYLQNEYMSLTDLYKLDDSILSSVLSEEDGVTYTYGQYFIDSGANSLMSALLCRECAKDNGIKLTSDDKAAIKTEKEKFISTLGGASAYNTFLSAIDSSDSAYDRYMQDMRYMSKLQQLFTDGEKYALTDEEIAAAGKEYDEKYITVRHILFLTTDTNSGTTLGDEDVAKAKAHAEETLAKLREGEDFEKLRLSESSTPDDGQMTFTTGEMLAEFETAAFALQIGEFSDIVKTQYGFHIIIRDPLTRDKYTTYYNTKISAKFSAYIESNASSATINMKDAYSTVTPR